MPTQESRAPRRSDVAVALVSLSLLAMLFAPVLAQEQDGARKNSCLNNCKRLTLGLLNHESARGFFPTASRAAWEAAPGNDSDPKHAGYSWQVQILPFMENFPLYMSMQANSAKFTQPPLSVVGKGADGTAASARPINLAATVQLAEVLCPAFAGSPVVDVAASDYKVDEQRGGAPAITNYFPTSASHLVKHDDGAWRLAGQLQPRALVQGNGILAFFSQKALDDSGSFTKLRGNTQASIRDGTSNTLFFAESREQAYAAWIDGQVAWVVAAWPQNSAPPQLMRGPGESPPAPEKLGWEPADLLIGVTPPLKKQRFGATADEAGVYLPEAMWSGTKDRKFGPSGNHPGVAAHAFADGHARMLSETLDPVVYLHLVTRAGMELIPNGAVH
jgi:hypothetical protein